MQINHIYTAIKGKVFSNYSIYIKVLIFVVSVSLILWTVEGKKEPTENYFKLFSHSWKSNPIILCFVILLMCVNWGIEVVKWKFLASKVEKITLKNALEGVLTGVTFGLITPHGLGDYLGRILHLESDKRTKALGAIFLSRIAQFYSTLYFGSVSILFLMLKWFTFTLNQKEIILVSLIISHLLLISILLFRKNILRYVENVNFFNFLTTYLGVLGQYSLREIFRALALSALRYLIFLFQFILMFSFFNVKSDFIFQLLAVPFVFLVKSTIPTIFDLGVREAAIIFIFGYKNPDIQSVLCSSFTVWIINVLIPSLIGLFLIFKLKIKKP